jgi:hypothetical protein
VRHCGIIPLIEQMSRDFVSNQVKVNHVTLLLTIHPNYLQDNHNLSLLTPHLLL